MNRLVVSAMIALLLQTAPLFAEECSVSTYETLVAAGKSADEAREWRKSVEAYSRILAECRALIKDDDTVKAYDSLSVAQLMQENYSEAIESAKKCLELDSKYNACMMTAARSFESVGDRSMAIEYARAAVEAGVYDEYSAAVAIYAKDFLKKIENK